MKDILTSLVTNLHILVLSLLMTALSLGVVGNTSDKTATSGERWRVMITTPGTTEAEPKQSTNQSKQPATRAYTSAKPDVPWDLKRSI